VITRPVSGTKGKAAGRSELGVNRDRCELGGDYARRYLGKPKGNQQTALASTYGLEKDGSREKEREKGRLWERVGRKMPPFHSNEVRIRRRREKVSLLSGNKRKPKGSEKGEGG